MRIHEQRDTYREALTHIEEATRSLIADLTRKIGRPYPDGTCAPEVNVNTDVLPRLRQMLVTSREAEGDCGTTTRHA